MCMRPMNRKMEMERWRERGANEPSTSNQHPFQPISTISFPITNYLFQQTNINYDRICAISIYGVYSNFGWLCWLFLCSHAFLLCDKNKLFCFPLIFGSFLGQISRLHDRCFVGTIKSNQHWSGRRKCVSVCVTQSESLQHKSIKGNQIYGNFFPKYCISWVELSWLSRTWNHLPHYVAWHIKYKQRINKNTDSRKRKPMWKHTTHVTATLIYYK